MSALDRSLLRELRHLSSQLAAVALVVAAGVALFVSLRSMHGYLVGAQRQYYQAYRFADVFVHCNRAPLAVAGRALEIPGVAAAEARIVVDVVADVPKLAEPAALRLISIAERRQPMLNDSHLARGRWIEPGSSTEILLSEAFARANGLVPGDSLGALVNGRWRSLVIAGTAQSPEYVYEIRGGAEIFPDNRLFGVGWMGYGALAAAFELTGTANDFAVALAPGASEAGVIEGLDRLLARYGGLGAYGRQYQISHVFLSGEIAETQVSSLLFPAIFLAVTAFLLHMVLSRLVATQREQIGLLKAFGYGRRAIGWHYMKLALVPVGFGALLGTAFGFWFADLLAVVYARFFQFPAARFRPEPGIAVAAVAIAGGAALLGALGAVARAVAMPPAEAMRPPSPPGFRAGPFERLGLSALLSPAGRIILRNLERGPVKALLSVTGLSLAVAIVATGWYSFDAVGFMRRMQFETVERQDLTVSFVEGKTSSALAELRHLPGVLTVEPFRVVAVRLRHGPLSYRTAVLGLDRAGELRRIADQRLTLHEPPRDGLLVTDYLARKLRVEPGDTVVLEALEGRRVVREVPIVGTLDELIGVAAYMEAGALARLLEEPRSISGAFLGIDRWRESELLARLKRNPGVAGVAVQHAVVASFDRTIAESFRISITVMVAFACVIAFGIAYNAVRVALSERGRELASLRVLGFSRREVATMLLGEQGLLTLAALPLGCALAWGLIALIAYRFDSELFRMPLVLSPGTFALASLVVVAAVALSALAVGRRLARLDLIAVLKTRE